MKQQSTTKKIFRSTIVVTIIALFFILSHSVAFAATEFTSTLMQSGGDYSSLATWNTAMTAGGGIDITATTTKVFSHSGLVGVIADGATTTGSVSGATAIAVHVTSSQILLKNIVGTFQSGEQVRVNTSNYVTLSNTGDSPILTAKIDGTWTNPDTTSVTLQNATTSATNYVRIYTTTAARHHGVWNNTAYRYVDNNYGTIYIYDLYMRIDGLQVSAGGGNQGAISLQNSQNDVRISNSIINSAVFGIRFSGVYSSAWNNIIYCTASGDGIQLYYVQNSNIYNNTVYGCATGINNTTGTAGNYYLSFHLKNNIAVANTTDYIGPFASDSTNNISQGTSSPNVSFQSKTISFVSTSTQNFHLASTDSPAIDQGVNLSADANLAFNTDIDGNARPQGPAWDIGADEYVYPPLVTLTVPTNGTTVSGSSVTLTATSSDGIGVAGVQFKVDGVNIGSSGTTSPYSITWDSTTVSNATHTLSAVANDAAGNYATSSITVTASNAANSIPPVISSISVATTSSSATITWTTDKNADSQVNYGLTSSYTASTTLNSTLTTSHSVTVSGLAPSTVYHYQARSADAFGNVGTSTDATFTTGPDITPPSVTMTAPPGGSTATKFVTLTATSTDNVAVTGVQFKVDNVSVGAVGTTSPYSIVWDSTSVSNGSHTIVAVAHDAAGNYATSTGISVTVSNIIPGTEFVSNIMQSGGDYSSLATWNTAMTAGGGIDITIASTKVFSHTGITGTIADGASVTGATSAATAIAVHVTSTQILLKNIVGTFQSGEQVRVNTSNYVTLSNAGNPSVLTAKISGTWSSPDSNTLYLQNATTSASDFIKIYATSTARQNGKWSSTAYTFAPGSYGHIWVYDDYVTIDGLQIQSPYGNSNPIVQTSPYDATSTISFSNNIMYGGGQGLGIMWIGGTGSIRTSQIVNIWNNILYDTTGQGIAINLNYEGPTYVYNNTIVGFGYGIITGGNVATNYHLKNNIANGNGVDYSGLLAPDSTNNISHDTTSPNASFQNKTVSFIDVARNNFFLSNADTAAIDQGVDLSTDPNVAFTTDIIGTSRPQGSAWDIGANEFTTSNSQPPVTYTVTASAGTGGTITPSGVTTVGSGVSQTYAMTPNAGYFVNSLVVDGTTILGQASYTFPTIIANHTISAVFAPNSQAGTSVTRPLLFHRITYSYSPLQTLYVSPTGSDTNNCSQASPCRQISYAVTLASPGTLISVADGTYNHFIISSTNGTAQNPIIIEAQGDNAIISPANTDTDGTRGNIYVHLSSYIIIDGLKTYNGTGALGDGLAVRTSPHVTVRNVVSGNNYDWALTSGYSDYITFENNEGYGSKMQHGMYIQNTTHYGVIRGNLLHDNPDLGLHNNGDQNTAPETDGSGNILYTGALTYTNTNEIIENNIFYNNGTGMDMDGGQNAIIRNNIVFNNRSKGITLFQQDAAHAPTNDEIYNNTVVMPAGSYAALRLTTSQGPMYVHNNILSTDLGACNAIFAIDDGSKYIHSDNNIWAGSGTCPSDFASWQSGGNDLHSTLLVASSSLNFLAPANGDFHLPSNSPAVDVATSSLASSEITWTTSMATDTVAEYGLTSSYTASTTADNYTYSANSFATTTHDLVLSGLLPNTTYHYGEYYHNGTGNLVQVPSTGDATFTTGSADVVVDRDGNTRPQGNAYDMGAYEYTIPVVSSGGGGSSSVVPTSSGGGGGYYLPLVTTSSTTTAAIISTTTPSVSTPTPPVTPVLQHGLIPAHIIFTRNLKVGMKGNDIFELQRFLNINGYHISLKGSGSLGKETTYFGLATKAALIKFQKVHHIVPSYGFFGILTRRFINSLRQTPVPSQSSTTIRTKVLFIIAQVKALLPQAKTQDQINQLAAILSTAQRLLGGK